MFEFLSFRSHVYLQKTRVFSRTFARLQKHFKLIIVGGGTGGASSAHNFGPKLGKDNVAVIEPADMHYYQPLWTLVGAGMKSMSQSCIPMNEALPKNVTRYKQRVTLFDPDMKTVSLDDGTKISYDFLIVAMGIQLNYDKIPGAVDALKNDDRVTSNYSMDTVQKTFGAIKNFKGGNALFSFPNTPVKCAGAPQKIMYLFDDILRRENRRDGSKVEYFTSLPVIFGVKKYAEKLMEICNSRDLKVNTRTNLIEVDPLNHIAKFENLDTKEKSEIEYNFLHITPPMSGYEVIASSKLSDPAGFVSVDRGTLQHTVYPNVFAIGDCSSLPTSKTAAAIAAQQHILYVNLNSLMNGGSADKLKYDGYTSCPLVTKHNKCILAEFDYSGEPLETLPIDQSKETRLAFYMKADLMPQLYWHGLIRGRWNGPSVIRKILHLGMGK